MSRSKRAPKRQMQLPSGGQVTQRPRGAEVRLWPWQGTADRMGQPAWLAGLVHWERGAACEISRSSLGEGRESAWGHPCHRRRSKCAFPHSAQQQQQRQPQLLLPQDMAMAICLVKVKVSPRPNDLGRTDSSPFLSLYCRRLSLGQASVVIMWSA